MVAREPLASLASLTSHTEQYILSQDPTVQHDKTNLMNDDMTRSNNIYYGVMATGEKTEAVEKEMCFVL